MAEIPTLVIRFKDVEHDETLKESIERKVGQLMGEFPETLRFEASLEQDGAGFVIHGHVTGKDIDVSTHGDGPDLRTAEDQLFHRIKQQLRRAHDKRIFQRRRAAQKASPKR